MERVKYHFCWIKAVRNTGGHSRSLAEMASPPAPTMVAADAGVADRLAVWLSVTRQAHPVRGGAIILTTPVPVPAENRRAGAGKNWSGLQGSTAQPQSTPVPVPAESNAAGGSGESSVRLSATQPGVWSTPVPVPAHSSANRSADAKAKEAADAGEDASRTARTMAASAAGMGNLHFGGATFMGAWDFEVHGTVKADSSDETAIHFEWQPVLGSRDMALAWRASAQGQDWCKDAIGVLLVSFIAAGEI